MKTTFVTPEGVSVEGDVIYTSPIYKGSNNFVDKCYDEIVYGQNLIAKIHHTLSLNDEDDFEEYKEPQIEILGEFTIIPKVR